MMTGRLKSEPTWTSKISKIWSRFSGWFKKDEYEEDPTDYGFVLRVTEEVPETVELRSVESPGNLVDLPSEQAQQVAHPHPGFISIHGGF